VIGGRFGGDLQARTTAKLLELLCFAAQAPRLLSASCGLLLLCVLAIGRISIDGRPRVCILIDTHTCLSCVSLVRYHHQHSRVELFIANDDKREPNRTNISTQRPSCLPLLLLVVVVGVVVGVGDDLIPQERRVIHWLVISDRVLVERLDDRVGLHHSRMVERRQERVEHGLRAFVRRAAFVHLSERVDEHHLADVLARECRPHARRSVRHDVEVVHEAEHARERERVGPLHVAASRAAERAHCVDHGRCSTTEHGAHGGGEAVAAHKHSSLLARRSMARASAQAWAIASLSLSLSRPQATCQLDWLVSEREWVAK